MRAKGGGGEAEVVGMASAGVKTCQENSDQQGWLRDLVVLYVEHSPHSLPCKPVVEIFIAKCLLN